MKNYLDGGEAILEAFRLMVRSRPNVNPRRTAALA